MYRIRSDKNGVTLVCRACIHTERVQDFHRNAGNQRTLAAQAMLEHVSAEHSREHSRACNCDGRGRSFRTYQEDRGSRGEAAVRLVFLESMHCDCRNPPSEIETPGSYLENSSDVGKHNRGSKWLRGVQLATCIFRQPVADQLQE